MAEEEQHLLPPLVSAERFLHNIQGTLGHMRGAEAEEVANRVIDTVRERVSTLHSALNDTDAATTDVSTSDCLDSSSDDDDETADALPLHLNPSLPISHAEYAAWLDLMRHLRSSDTFNTSDAPRKLLLLMSRAFTQTIASEACEALARLYRQHKEDWFSRDLYKPIKRVVLRALGLLGVSFGGANVRKLRLKQRRKVFKARKRIWDTERRVREDLEEEFGALMGVMGANLRCSPSWFDELVTEHYESLREQFARSLLEEEYASSIAHLQSHQRALG